MIYRRITYVFIYIYIYVCLCGPHLLWFIWYAIAVYKFCMRTCHVAAKKFNYVLITFVCICAFDCALDINAEILCDIGCVHHIFICIYFALGHVLVYIVIYVRTHAPPICFDEQNMGFWKTDYCWNVFFLGFFLRLAFIYFCTSYIFSMSYAIFA